LGLVLLHIDNLLDALLAVELGGVLSEIAALHLSVVQQVFHVVKHQLRGGHRDLARLVHILNDSKSFFSASSWVFFHFTLIGHDLLELLEVDMLRVLLHHDAVEWISQFVRDCLRHQLGAHGLGHCSLEMDTAGHAGELENLALVLSILVLRGFNLNVLLLVQ
jgi:hypothetical protein